MCKSANYCFRKTATAITINELTKKKKYKLRTKSSWVSCKHNNGFAEESFHQNL